MAAKSASIFSTAKKLQLPDDGELCLSITTKTWSRDSFELFDYDENPYVNEQTYELKQNAKLFRNHYDIKIVCDGNLLPSQSIDYLISIQKSDGQFIVSPADKSHVRLTINRTNDSAADYKYKKLWLVVKDLPNSYYSLQESDIIRLGRCKLKVKKIVATLTGDVSENNDTLIPELSCFNEKVKKKVELSRLTTSEIEKMDNYETDECCRICLLEDSSNTNPLLSPCQCKGSLKFIHLNCLKRWVIEGRFPEMSKSSCLAPNRLQCELCKALFPSTFFINGQQVYIVDNSEISPPFIVLETTTGRPMLFTTSLAYKSELTLGRGHETDIQITDVAVSRNHATIRYSNGLFLLEDTNSKFGTLVNICSKQVVGNTSPLVVQVGRTVINFKITKPSCKFEDVIEVGEHILTDDPEKLAN